MTNILRTGIGMNRMLSASGRAAALVSLAVWTLAAQTVKGPDAFGYTATNGAVSSFQDISTTGVRVLQNSEDDTLTIGIGFPFRFYQRTGGYTTVCINVNGLLTFNGCEDSEDSFANRNLTQFAPTKDLPAIAAYWSDLTFNDPNADAVYYQTVGAEGDRRLIVQWNKAYDDQGNLLTFQVLLFERTGEIQLRYLDFGALNPGDLFGGNAVVGIRAAQGQATGNVLQWSDNVAVLAQGQSIRFAYPDTNACPLQISQDAASHTSAAETGGVGVTIPAGCPWTATTQQDWITLTAGLTGSGNGNVAYTLSANSAPAPRQGTVKIGDKLLSITQAAAAQRMIVGSSTLALTAQQGSGTAAAQVALSSDIGTLPFTLSATSDHSFLSASADAATTPATVSVTANAAGLAAGTYSGTITVNAPDAANAQETIAVTLTVTAAPPPPPANETSLSVSSSGLSFQIRQGSAAMTGTAFFSVETSPTSKSFGVAVIAAPAFLSASVSSTVTPASVIVKVDATGLAPGTYHATLSVSAAGASNGPLDVPVTLEVLAAPKLAASTPAIALRVQQGAGSPVVQQKFTVSSDSGAAPVTVSATSDQNFLAVAADSASTPATVTVTADASKLAPGTYSGTVRIASAGSSNSPLSVPVNLTVLAPGLAASEQVISVDVARTDRPVTFTKKVDIVSPAPVGVTAAVTGGNFLSAALSADSTPAALHVWITATGLQPGSYTGTVTVTAAGGQGTVSIPVTLNVTAAGTGTPKISDEGVTNGATFQAAPIAPGSIGTIWGVNLAADALPGPAGEQLPLSISGVSVTVNGVPAPLFYVSPGQINFQLPYETAAGDALVVVTAHGAASESFTIRVEPARPAIFMMPGGQHAAALNQDYSLNSPQNPVAPGKPVFLYLTGLGPLDSPLPSGALAPLDRLIRATGKVEATIGGKPAVVQFAGLAPGFAGLAQVNLILPDDAPPGGQEVIVTVDGVPGNAALISVAPK